MVLNLFQDIGRNRGLRGVQNDVVERRLILAIPIVLPGIVRLLLFHLLLLGWGRQHGGTGRKHQSCCGFHIAAANCPLADSSMAA